MGNIDIGIAVTIGSILFTAANGAWKLFRSRRYRPRNSVKGAWERVEIVSSISNLDEYSGDLSVSVQRSFIENAIKAEAVHIFKPNHVPGFVLITIFAGYLGLIGFYSVDTGDESLLWTLVVISALLIVIAFIEIKDWFRFDSRFKLIEHLSRVSPSELARDPYRMVIESEKARGQKFRISNELEKLSSGMLLSQSNRLLRREFKLLAGEFDLLYKKLGLAYEIRKVRQDIADDEHWMEVSS